MKPIHDNCPECGRGIILFADYDKNDLDALGIRCRCGWGVTMKDVIDENTRLEQIIASIRTFISKVEDEQVPEKEM